MANWRLAESLKKLREEINAEFPDRSKASDGSVGDTRHQANKSDHNPNSAGIVCAIDVTHDPRSGCTGDRIAAVLIKSQDPRIKYIIWKRRMISSYPSGNSPGWTWRPYKGANPHDHHIHISVMDDKSLVDSKADWHLDFDIAVARAESDLEAEDAPNSIQHSGAESASQPSNQSSTAQATEALPEATNATPAQTNEAGSAGVIIQPNALTEPAKPIVSAPGDKPIEATTGGFKSMVTSAVGWLTGAGAGLVALLKDNQTLLIIAAVILVIAGLAYFIRQLILDRERLRIAADPTKWNAK